jgi:hypothetical protein
MFEILQPSVFNLNICVVTPGETKSQENDREGI